MTPADHARNNAISLEAKKDALAQRQNGDWKVSFTVQGIDMDTRLTQAPMGTRYAVVLVEIGDDETPVNRKEAIPNHPTKPTVDSRPAPNPPARAKGEKMDWREVQPAAQAGIRCADPVFVAFLKTEHAEDFREFGNATDVVRNWCNVISRSELSTNHKARVIWKQLDDQFQAWKALEHA